MKMFLLLLFFYVVSASIIRKIVIDPSPMTNVSSCCSLCPSYKTKTIFKSKKTGGKLDKNKKKKNQALKLNEDKNNDDPHMQSTCTHKTISAIKNFEKTLNWTRQTKRIKVWVTQAAKKSTKAASAFQDGLNALVTATKDGTACAGAGLDTNTQDILDTLRSCSVTAAAACDTSTLDTSGLSQCEIDLGAWIDSFKVGPPEHLTFNCQSYLTIFVDLLIN